MEANHFLQQVLERAVSETIEKIAFEEPEILPDPVEISGDVVGVSLRVVSPYLLMTMILMPRELADKLIHGIYRDDEKEINEGLLYDTVGEFLNTIIGTMMGEVTHGERIFEMGLPERIEKYKEFQSENFHVSCFQIDGQIFSVAIEGDIFVEDK